MESAMQPLKLNLEQIEVESFDTSRGVAGRSGTVMGHQLTRPVQPIASDVCEWTNQWNGGCQETGITVYCDPNCGDTVGGPTAEFSCDLEDPTQVNC
jgi:hypothetical protein